MCCRRRDGETSSERSKGEQRETRVELLRRLSEMVLVSFGTAQTLLVSNACLCCCTKLTLLPYSCWQPHGFYLAASPSSAPSSRLHQRALALHYILRTARHHGRPTRPLAPTSACSSSASPSLWPSSPSQAFRPTISSFPSPRLNLPFNPSSPPSALHSTSDSLQKPSLGRGRSRWAGSSEMMNWDFSVDCRRWTLERCMLLMVLHR